MRCSTCGHKAVTWVCGVIGRKIDGHDETGIIDRWECGSHVTKRTGALSKPLRLLGWKVLDYSAFQI